VVESIEVVWRGVGAVLEEGGRGGERGGGEEGGGGVGDAKCVMVQGVDAAHTALLGCTTTRLVTEHQRRPGHRLGARVRLSGRGGGEWVGR
jgi:hypothetical protein